MSLSLTISYKIHYGQSGEEPLSSSAIRCHPARPIRVLMPDHDGGDEPADELSARRAVGPAWRLTYDPNKGKHGPEPRGEVSREPRNGQDALDCSIRVKPTSTKRIGIDYDDDNAIVVFQRHETGEFPEQPGQEIFHGFVVEWRHLRQELKNALLRARMVNRRGKVL